ncbi:UNVERIFIED_CONTAM: Retrovirus-related Pol polyprotein from transposon RE1 [Sesamum radiatum]|uniref:Retrovirus-related Pol polyprotein from transposon RE1 n=1 Tax=Sesamum radiatum TaxID=300843 RepID=A0AAW2R1S0_SESRA
MKSYLKSQTLWDAVENDVDPPALRANPTLAQIKKHEEDLAKKPKALTCLHSALSDVIFTRIMACETPKEAWDKLRDEFEGSERVKMVKLLTLKMEFEMLRMKDGEIVKEYSSKFLDTVNKIRLLGEDFSDLYRSLIGSLLYLTATRPYLMYAAGVLSKFMQSPDQVHMGVTKRVLRYVKGVFSWLSKKQEVVAQSTADAEYMATVAAVNQAIWLRKVLTDLHLPQASATVIFVNNQSAISMAKNPVHHGRTKHINVKFHAIRVPERNGEVELIHFNSDVQVADILTKSLSKGRSEVLRVEFGVLRKNLNMSNDV